MTFRLACDIGDRLAAAISIAGGMWSDDDKCPAPGQLSMVVVHSDDDDSVAYEGSQTGAQQYKGALESTAYWAQHNGCTDALEFVESVDLVEETAGNETEVYRHSDCEAGTTVEHWKMLQASHQPNFSDGVFAEKALDILLTARRP